MNDFDLDRFDKYFNNSKNIDTNYLTHNFHSYPAKFIPQIPRGAIENFTKKGEVVMDPFCGCGTTLVEAKLLNRRSIGIDSNPLSCLISKSKTTKIENFLIINKFIKLIKEDIEKLYTDNNFKNEITLPTFFNIDHWFQKNIQYEIFVIKRRICELKNEQVKNFLQVALSSILVKVSNQESDTRYAAIEKNLKNGDVLNLFIKKLENMIVRMKEFNKTTSDQSCEIYNIDTRNLYKVKDESVDLIVTSPPYANTYDYYLYHKLRMFWLDMDVKKAQEIEFGSRNLHNDKHMEISHYNENLSLCLKEMNRTLKKEKYLCIVIGDCIIRKKFINISPIVIGLAENNNFEYIGELKHPLKLFSRTFNPNFTKSQKFEHIMFFKKKRL